MTIVVLFRSGNHAHPLIRSLDSIEGPLVLHIDGALASKIRLSAGWAGRSPEAQAIEYLRHAFDGRQ